ncbi:MAG: ABC transporter permease [Kiritimatiellia bacterium]
MYRLAAAIYRYRELLLILVARNLKIRYKSSMLGFFWSLLVPIALIVIYSFFLNILKVSTNLATLVVGIIVWQFLVTCMGDSLHAIIGNGPLVKKTSFPRIILPMAMVLGNLVNFFLSCVVLAAFLIVVGSDVGSLYFLPFAILTQIALCTGLALVISSSNVFFRDTEHLVSIITIAWFFLTPVIYPFSFVRDNVPQWEYLLSLNPMAGIVETYRSALISAPPMPEGMLAVSFTVAWTVFIAGIIVFQLSQSRFAEEL